MMPVGSMPFYFIGQAHKTLYISQFDSAGTHPV